MSFPAGAGKFLGWIAALAFIWAFATSGSTWIMGSDRTLAVACFDGVGPRILGKFSAALVRRSMSTSFPGSLPRF